MGNMRFKVGDRVRIKSLDWYNRYTNGTEVDCGAYPFTSDMKEFCGQERIIANVCQDCYVLLDIDEYEEDFLWTDEMIEGLVEEEMPLDKAGQMTDFEYEGLAYTLPDGYIFKDENGNEILTNKIILEKKKKEYPKTYEECCEVLGYSGNYNMILTTDVDNKLFNALYRLKVCRDAYWKIAGKEMGLGKPWEPDWCDTSIKYCLERDFDAIDKNVSNHKGRTFAFPTEEMRDAFYENFKEEIESVKELL